MAYNNTNNGGLEGARTSFGERGSSSQEENRFGMTAESFERQLRESVGAPANERAAQNPFNIAKHIVETGDASYLKHLEEMVRMSELAKTLSSTQEESDYYENEINTYATQIEKIQRQVDTLRNEELYIQEIQETENKINDILNNQEFNFERALQLLGNINFQDFREIDTVISEITRNLSSNHQNIGDTNTPLDYLTAELRSKISRYQQTTGKNYDAKINYYSEDLIKKYAGVFCLAQKRIQDIMDNEPNNPNYSDYEYINARIKELINMLYLVHNNPLRIDQIKTEIEETIKTMSPSQTQTQTQTQTQASPNKDAFKQGLKIYLNSIYQELAEYTIDSVKQFIPQSSYPEIAQKESELLAALKNGENDILTPEEKEAIKEEVKNEVYNQKLEKAFGKKGAEFISTPEYSKLLEQIQNISSYNHATVDFETVHNEFKTTVDTLQRAGVLNGVSVDYDENNSKISIIFREGTMGTIEHNVVSPKIREQQDLMTRLLQIKTSFKPSFDSCIKALYPTEEFKNLANQIKSLTTPSRYPHLTIDEITTILDQSGIYQEVYESYGKEYAMNLAQQNGEAYNPNVAIAYGQEFTNFMMQVMKYYKAVDLTALDNVQHGTPEYISAYEKLYNSVMTFINAVKSIENYDKYISISFDEEKQQLKISYKNNIVEDFEVQIVPNDILNRRGRGAGEPPQSQQTQTQTGNQGPIITPPTGTNQSQTQSQGQSPSTQQQRQTPGQPAPSPIINNATDVTVPQDKEAAIQKYIDEVNHYNELVGELNLLNQDIAMAEIPLTLDVNELEQICAKEAQAKQEENKLRDIRQKLAKYRFEYKNIHNEYITQNPQIVATQMNEPVFGASMQDFIQIQDDMALDAEKAIRILANRRAQEPNNFQELTNQIRQLAAYIDSRNSIIGRCLVAESKNSNIDIVSILAERRANKRSKREMITRALMGENVDSLDQSVIIPGGQQDLTPPTGNDQSQTQGQASDPEPPIQTQTQSQPKVVRFELRLKETPKINRQVSQIEQGVEPLTCQIIKNKLKIQFSAELKEKLKDLSAKVSLVDKMNKLKRTSVEFDPTQEFQELGFADGRDITADDYRIEIRSNNGKKSEILYNGDIVQVDEGPTRTR